MGLDPRPHAITDVPRRVVPHQQQRLLPFRLQPIADPRQVVLGPPLTDPAGVFAAMVRVCKPGGRVTVADVFTNTSEQAAAYDQLEQWRDPSHTHALQLSELEPLFAGLKDIRREFYKYPVRVDDLLPVVPRSGRSRCVPRRDCRGHRRGQTGSRGVATSRRASLRVPGRNHFRSKRGTECRCDARPDRASHLYTSSRNHFFIHAVIDRCGRRE